MSLFAELVAVSRRVGATSARLAKVRELAAHLRAVEPSEIDTAVHYLSGDTPQGRFGIGYAVLRKAVEAGGAAANATLAIAAVDRSLAAVAAIRANPGITQTPIVILAQNGADSVRLAMEHGADDYVTQPLAREELLRVVDFRLRRNESLRDFSSNITAVPTPSVAPTGEVDPVALQALRSTSGVTSTAMFTARSAGYVDPVAASPQEARYGTVLFSDIRSFSTLAEALTTMEVAEVLNAYFVRACEPILQQGGWIVKLLGDGVLALFEPGSHREDHAERALRAALFHVIVAQRFNQWLSRRFPDRPA